jgi:peptidoglycan/LPS O-acetylase OafA/YrhL
LTGGAGVEVGPPAAPVTIGAPLEGTSAAQDAIASPKQRSVELDVLRTVAILLVLGRHSTLPYEEAGRLQPLAAYWHRLGWSGVDLFFVLSGFLVGGLLFKELGERGQIDVRRFLIRRGFKIWPAYVIYLGCLLLGLTFIETRGDIGYALGRLLPNFVHAQNYFDGTRRHTWSLAVEEHFYLMLPLVLVFASRRRAPAAAGLPLVPKIAAGLVLGCTALRGITTALWPFKLETHFWPTHLRIDSLFFGVFLAYLHHYRPGLLAPASRHHGKLLLLGAALVLPMGVIPFSSAIVPTVGLTMLYVGYGAILLAVVHAPQASLLSRLFRTTAGRWLGFIGLHSYSIYLWHIDLAQIPIIKLLKRGVAGSLPAEIRWLAAMFVYVVVAFAVGLVMALLIERPALKLRERLFPPRARASAPRAAS